MKHTALITGASSGIGAATARKLAEEGYRLILCGRRAQRLRALAAEVHKLYQTECHTLAFDVSEEAQVRHALGSLQEPFAVVDLLVNNAGNAHGLAPFQDADVSDFEAMLGSNVTGLMYVTKAALPLLQTARYPMVINVGSIAGKEAYPNGNVYCATKAAVDSLTAGLRHDLLPLGIRVGAIHPGLVETEFSLVRFKGNEQRAQSVYQGLQPLTAADVAEALWFMASRPPHVNVADMVLFPSAQASATHVLRKQI